MLGRTGPRAAIGPALLCSILLAAAHAQAEGTETLGLPGVPVAAGSGIAIGGVGLQLGQPAALEVEVPADAQVEQVLLYWAGAYTGGNAGDDTITVDGIEVTGTEIGGPAFFFNAGGSDRFLSSFRADITGLGLIGPGANSISVGGLDNTAGGPGANSGAGILVVTDDGSAPADVQLRDGVDIAFDLFPAPRDATVPQSFVFEPANVDRVADLALFVAGTDGATNRILVTVDGAVTEFTNLLDTVSGPLWNSLTLPIDIPAGASTLTVELVSGDGVDPGTCLEWVMAALSVPGIEVLEEPAISIDVAPDVQVVPAHDRASFTITVSNVGGVDLGRVFVLDLRVPRCTRWIGELGQGAEFSYECSRRVGDRSFVHRAYVIGSDAEGTVVFDHDEALVLVNDDD